MNTSSRSGVLLVGLTMLLGHSGQARQASELATFRAGTTLIELTVVAEDEHGNPVSDLRQEEISIIENGRARDVVFFHFEGGSEPRPVVKGLPPGIFSNRPEYAPGPPRNVTAIVIDAVNTRPQDQVQVRDQILRYLLQSPPDGRVAIYRASERVHILHDFTNDYESLRTRLATKGVEATPETQTQVSVKVETPMIEEWLSDLLREYTEAMLQRANEDNAHLEERSNQEIHDRRSRLTLQALEALGTHLAGIPGRKSLVWISSGSPIMSAGTRDPWLKNYEAAVRGTAQRLASQGITCGKVESRLGLTLTINS